MISLQSVAPVDKWRILRSKYLGPLLYDYKQCLGIQSIKDQYLFMSAFDSLNDTTNFL
jgi:hypothetical protein